MNEEILNENFLEMIKEIYSCENQILDALPLMVNAASYEDLKEAFTKHLKDTKEQVKRIESIFKLLHQSPKEKKCYGMKGIIEEGREMIKKKDMPGVFKDACLIMAAQKVEHYEIATYGCLCAFVTHLSKALKKPVYKQILELLETSLAEEKKADLLLTQLAEGTRILTGINEELEVQIKSCCS